MAENQRKELENEITNLSDEDLDKVAGGNYWCDPGLVPDGIGCWECEEFAELYGTDSIAYRRVCE